MKYVKFLGFAVLFVFVGIGVVGGCGGGGGGNGGDGTDLESCLLPGLNTDFSDSLYLFIDEPNNVLMGVSSTGDEVAIALSDIVPDPEVLGLGAVPLDANQSMIELALVGDLILDASGEGVRTTNGAKFEVNDLIVADIPLGVDLEGACDSVEPLVGTAEESLKSISRGLAQQRAVGEQYPTNIKDYINNALPLDD